MSNKVFYVVHKGRQPGIYNTWRECSEQIEQFKGAVYKKFDNQESANKFLKNGFDSLNKSNTNNTNNSTTNNENIEDNEKNKRKMMKKIMEKKNTQKINQIENENEDDKIYIYTDGSLIRSKNNVTAGYGYYIPSLFVSVSKPLVDSKITNNRAEMRAIIESVEILKEDERNKHLCIFTDSQYSIYIFNGTGERYEKNNWIEKGKEVPNIDLIQKMLELKRNYNITLIKVLAHTNNTDEHSRGNRVADQLANEAAKEGQPKYENKLNSLIFKCDSDEENVDEIFEKNKKVQQITRTNKKIIENNKGNLKMNELFEIEEGQNDITLNKTNKIERVLNKKLISSNIGSWFLDDPN